jgi:hypothetical protein
MPNNPPDPTVDFVQFLNTIGNVTADKVNPHFRSKYSSLGEILDTIKEHASKHNLAVRQMIQSEDGRVSVVTSFLHISGKEFDGGKLSFKTDGLDPQKLGSCLTYLRRQSVSTACMLSTETDDDGAKASTPASTQQAKEHWFEFIPVAQRKFAIDYLISKNWLPKYEDGEVVPSFKSVAQDKVEMILSNKQAFLKAISK